MSINYTQQNNETNLKYQSAPVLKYDSCEKYNNINLNFLEILVMFHYVWLNEK